MNSGANEIESPNIMVRLASIYTASDSFTPAPLIARLQRETGMNICDGLSMSDLRIPDMCRGGDWKFVMVTCDAAPSNAVATRRTVSDLSI